MINAYFQTFLKKENSTKIPIDITQSGTNIPIVLLDDCSIMTPKIRLKTQASPIAYNYVYIPDFGNRYFFVTDWTSDHGFWIASLTCDVLGTYRSAIFATSPYVLRSASDYDLTIGDSYYPMKYDYETFRYPPKSSFDSLDPNPYFPFKSGESYIVGVSGIDYTQFHPESIQGSVTYYWMSKREFAFLILYLLNETSYLNISDLSSGLQKALINPLQYINSCLLIPMDKPSNLTQVTNMHYGWYDFNPVTDLNFQAQDTLTLAPLGNKIWGSSFNLTGNFRHHPQIARGKYLDCAPYSEYYLTWEPFGKIPLDGTKLMNAEGIRAEVEMEPISGNAILKVYPYVEDTEGGQTVYVVDRYSVIAYAQAQIAVPVRMDMLSTNQVEQTFGAIGTVAGVVGGFLSGNIAGGIGALTSGITNAVESSFPNIETKGVNGSRLNINTDGPYLYVRRNLIVEEDLADLGRPLCQTKLLSTVSGYIICKDPEIEISGTQAEAIKIKNYLAGGMFIE